MKKIVMALFVISITNLATNVARGEEIKIATYNVELFAHHFLAFYASTQPLGHDPAAKEVLDVLHHDNDKDNWETAQVILDAKFSPDILFIEEGCDQGDLSYFNKHWLNDAYETVIQFPGNSERHQSVDLLMKKDFHILERKDKYYLEPDPVGNDRGNRLFARGPAFIKVKSPGGYVFWVGGTHMKSKAIGPAPQGENRDPKAEADLRIAATKWRNREAVRTHQILKELESQGPSDVILVGDMNDALGMDEIEKQVGEDGLADLVGPPADGFVLVTKPLIDAHQWSFNGYWRDKYREVIDHVIVSRSMQPKVKSVVIFQDGCTPVSSDHFPVLVKVVP